MSLVRIADLGTVIRGVSWDKTEASDVSMPGYVPVLRAGNISDRLDTDNDLVWVPASNVSATQTLRVGDIAICMSSGSASVVGKTAISHAAWPGSVGAFCAILRADPTICLPEYLAFYLKSPPFRAWTSEAQGANIKNIKKSALENFKIELPNIAEQRRIVDVLTRAESIVRLRREAQQKAAELVPAIFLDMFGDPATNPKGWPTTKLGDYLAINSSVRTPDLNSEAGLPCIGADSIESGTGKIVSWPTVDEIRPISGKYFFEVGDVLYSKIRPALRKVIVAPTIGYCSADMYPLRADADKAMPEYVAALLLSNAFTEYAVGVSARAQMPKVNRETLFAYEHPLPPLSLQKVFAERVQAVGSIAEQQASATNGAELSFQSLLARSFSGRT